MIVSFTVLETYADGSPSLIEVEHDAPYDRGDGVTKTTDRWQLHPGADPNAEILAWEAETAMLAEAPKRAVAVAQKDRLAVEVDRTHS